MYQVCYIWKTVPQTFLLTDVSESSLRASIYDGELMALYIGGSIHLCMHTIFNLFIYSTNKLSTYYMPSIVWVTIM